MTLVAHIHERMEGWVHEAVRSDPIEAAKHLAFMAIGLAVTLMTVVGVPPYLAFNGRIGVWEGMLIAAGLIPAIAVVILSRSGRIFLAHDICLGAQFTACAALAYGAGSLAGPTIAWLILAPFQSALVASARRVKIVSALAIAALMLAIVCQVSGWLAADADMRPIKTAYFTAPAIICAALLALANVQINLLRRRLARQGDARFNALSSVMGDLALRHDRSGAVVAVGCECESLFGLPSRELMGRGLFERILVQDRPLFLKAIADADASDGRFRCDLRLRTGSTASEHGDFSQPVFTWVELRARRLCDDRGVGAEQGQALSLIHI